MDRTTDSTHAAGGSRLRRWTREALPTVALLLLLLLARTSFANHYLVPSGSMQPTLQPGDHVAVDMSAYGVRLPFTDIQLLARDQPRAGDVVVFASPADRTRLIKRVVAVAGDEVELRGGQLRVNHAWLAMPGLPVREHFAQAVAELDLDAGGGPDIAPMRIPPGKLLVLGDHRGNSADGRFFGLVDAGTVYGRALAVFWRSGEGPVWRSLRQ